MTLERVHGPYTSWGNIINKVCGLHLIVLLVFKVNMWPSLDSSFGLSETVYVRIGTLTCCH